MTILQYSDEDICLNLLVTSICNAGCPWCIANEYMTSKKSYDLIPPKNVQIVIDRLEREKVRQVNLLGGEPSLHPDVLDIGKKIDALGVPVGFSTNGLWSDEFSRRFDSVDYPLEIEVTYLGESHPNYCRGDIQKLKSTFLRLQKHSTSLGLIIADPGQPYIEHLDIAERHGFNLRWALLEPTRKSGQVWGYRDRENVRALGKHISAIVKQANARGIETWADLSVPKCAIVEEDIYLFRSKENDIQFGCPPFFDISPNLDIWRCLPLAPQKTPKLTDFDSFKEAYRLLNNVKVAYLGKGIFLECNGCRDLDSICSGGPVIAKQLK